MLTRTPAARLLDSSIDDVDFDEVVRRAPEDVAQCGEGVYRQPLRRCGDELVDLFAGEANPTRCRKNSSDYAHLAKIYSLWGIRRTIQKT